MSFLTSKERQEAYSAGTYVPARTDTEGTPELSDGYIPPADLTEEAKAIKDEILSVLGIK